MEDKIQISVREFTEMNERLEELASEKSLLTIQLQKLNRIYSVLSNINQAAVRIHDANELFKEVCSIIIEYGKFHMVWIGRVNFQENIVEVVASNGNIGDYLDKINIDLNNDLRCSGPTGIAIKTGKSKFSNNIPGDDTMNLWLEDALKYGYKSCASFPLKVFNKVTYAFTIYSDEIGFFEENDINLLDRMANEISFALEYIETESGRRKAEKALHESEERYRTVFQGAAEGILIAEIESKKFIYANPAQCRMLGYTIEELLTMSFEDIHPKKDLEWVLSEFMAQARGEKMAALEIPCLRKDGSVFYTNISATAALINGKRCNVGFFSDITERKQAVESLWESSQMLKLVLDNMPAFVFWKDRNSVYLGCNYLFAANAGLSAAKDIVGLTDFDLPWKYTEAESYRIDDKNVMDTGVSKINYEETQFTADGRLTDVRTSKIPLRNPEGEIIGVLGTFEDITEHKLAEKALRESEQKFRSLAESSPDNIIKYDLECRAVYVNHNLKKTLNSANSLLIGKTPLEVAPDNAPGVQEYQAKLLQVMRTGQPDEVEIVVPGLSGTSVTHHVIFVPERYNDGKIIGALAIGRDVTEQKRSEEEIRKLNQDLETRVANRTKQLEDANKELEAFAYSVSHDLRAPLRGIDGFSMALLEDYHDKIDDQGNIYLNKVRSAAQRMAQLIDDMLSLSRISRTEMNIQQVNLSEMFREIAENLRGTQQERKISFVIHEGIIVNGDSRLLRIVLENLIENSLKFTSKHPKSRIEFGVNDQDKTQVYFIRDDGAGFDMNYSVKLFGAFQRLHNENEFPGTGIGLATIQRIIYRHGGKVWAEGAVEKGATFYFTLPESKT